MSNVPKDNGRRRFLTIATSVVGGVGAAAAAVGTVLNVTENNEARRAVGLTSLWQQAGLRVTKFRKLQQALCDHANEVLKLEATAKEERRRKEQKELARRADIHFG